MLFVVGCNKPVTMNQIDTKHNLINSFEVDLDKNSCEFTSKDISVGKDPIYTVTEVDGKTVITFDKRMHGSFFFSSSDVSKMMAKIKTECENQKVKNVDQTN